MRILINKFLSTKPERIFMEILKKNHIPFKHRVDVGGVEVDFIIGNYAVEIDGHQQSPFKNAWLLKQGYNLIHYNNNALYSNRTEVERDIKQRYGFLSKNSR